MREFKISPLLLLVSITCMLMGPATAQEPNEVLERDVERDVFLGKMRGETLLNKLLFAKASRKKTSIINDLFVFNPIDSWKRKLMKLHEITLGSGMGMINCPPHFRMNCV